MAFTDNCSLYFAVNETGVNRIGQHIMQQRPSLFNYATPDVAANRELWCQVPKFTEDVTLFGNPVFHIIDQYIPVIGADSPPVGLGFCAQVTRAEIDFYPGNAIALPPPLALEEQQLAAHLTLCGGVVCADTKILDQISTTKSGTQKGDSREPPAEVHVRGQMDCFCLDAFVTAHVAIEEINGARRLIGKIDGVEIVDVQPKGLEAILECYIRTALVLFLRQKLTFPIAELFLKIPLLDLGTVTIAPTPNPRVAHNPAVEDDQLKVFVDVTV
jgi:hypothetical protein